MPLSFTEVDEETEIKDHGSETDSKQKVLPNFSSFSSVHQRRVTHHNRRAAVHKEQTSDHLGKCTEIQTGKYRNPAEYEMTTQFGTRLLLKLRKILV